MIEKVLQRLKEKLQICLIMPNPYVELFKQLMEGKITQQEFEVKIADMKRININPRVNEENNMDNINNIEDVNWGINE